ncbi:MAG TPA: NHLP leader peptide family RiPP precursor [bacterium]|nr:NHLP leader peptide family RiPP precursor [bacterium]
MAEKPDQKEFAKEYAQIVARAWSDSAFKQRLLSDPASVLREYKLDPPAGVQVRIVEQTDKVAYFVLPAKPPGDLSVEQLGSVAAGSCSTLCTAYACPPH